MEWNVGGQEEPQCGSYYDEPGLQQVPLHFHHHSGEDAARRWPGTATICLYAVSRQLHLQCVGRQLLSHHVQYCRTTEMPTTS